MAWSAVHAREIGKAFALFAGAFVALTFILAMLGQLGMPDVAVAIILAATMLVAIVAIGLFARTMQISEFFLAGRSISDVQNGMATAAAFASTAAFLGLAGAFFSDDATPRAIVTGWVSGFVLLSVLIAPYFRKSGANGVTDFLAIRFGGKAIRLVGAAMVTLLLLSALAAAIAAAALIIATLMPVTLATAFAVAIIAVLATSVFGGMRAVTLSGIAQYIIMAIAFVAPIAIFSALEYRVPIPQLTYGLAIEEIVARAGDALSVLAENRFLPITPTTLGGEIAIALSLAAGVACLPHVIMRSATVPSAGAARRSGAWSLIFLLVILLTAPAYAAFARLAILQDVVGADTASLRDWVFAYGQLGLVRICGLDALSPEAINAACAAIAADARELAAANIAVGGESIVLAWSDIVGFPFISTALIAAGALAAALAAGSAIVFAIAATLGHDLYANTIDVRAPAGRRLILTRLLMIAVTLLAAWLAATSEYVFELAAAAPALAAAGFFPAVVLGIWWKRATGAGAVTGMIAGFLASGVSIAVSLWGWTSLAGVDLEPLGVQPLAAGIMGLPVGFAVVIAVSLLSPVPSTRRMVVVDNIRRPGRGAVSEESEIR